MERTRYPAEAGGERRGIGALFSGLADSGLDLARSTARMAASEGRIVLHRLAVRLGFVAAGLLVAAVGLHLGLQGTSVVLAQAFEVEPWVVLVVLGAVTLATGCVLAARAIRSVSRPDISFPATLAEIDLDIAAIRERRGSSGEGPE